ncbi:hypothetical protein [Achromobacter mucicolens]|nr:hypothetical protein [Achromobacter mucicolens]
MTGRFSRRTAPNKAEIGVFGCFAAVARHSITALGLAADSGVAASVIR